MEILNESLESNDSRLFLLNIYVRRNLQFSEIYTYLIENDTISQSMVSIFNKSDKELTNYLGSVKRENPYLFGQIIAYAYADTRTRKKLLSAIT